MTALSTRHKFVCEGVPDDDCRCDAVFSVLCRLLVSGVDFRLARGNEEDLGSLKSFLRVKAAGS